MATLDFSELAGKPSGETFEALVRLIGARLGLTVFWTGRGADQGRDLTFTETRSGTMGATPTRWLVNCKDNSKTNQSVSEQDVGSIVDKAQQHGCQGFLRTLSKQKWTHWRAILRHRSKRGFGPALN